MTSKRSVVWAGWVNRGIIHASTGDEDETLHGTMRWQLEHGFAAAWLDHETRTIAAPFG